MSIVNERWFERGGSVFSEVEKLKRTQDFRFAENFKCNESVALNVGHAVAKHMVEVHNRWLDEQQNN